MKTFYIGEKWDKSKGKLVEVNAETFEEALATYLQYSTCEEQLLPAARINPTTRIIIFSNATCVIEILSDNKFLATWKTR